jgi:hypothetical protein
MEYFQANEVASENITSCFMRVLFCRRGNYCHWTAGLLQFLPHHE